MVDLRKPSTHLKGTPHHMTTKILTSSDYPDLQPSQMLWKMYQPENAPFRFQSSSRKEAVTWQEEIRPRLEKQLGFSDLPATNLEPTLLESVDCGTYIREKVLLRTSTKMLLPVYLLLPKNHQTPAAAVIAFHGHGYGVKDIVGLWEDGSERTRVDGYQKDFAVELCKNGFIVAAPEISCFGERQTDFSYLDKFLGQEEPSTCAHTAFLASFLGGTVLGLRVFEGKRLLDYLVSRPEVDSGRIGAMGISGGGMHTFYSTCLDMRIKASVISGYYSTFAASILAMNHCPCNYIPGIWQFGEMYDLLGLIAPRPVLIEAATRDQFFPIDAVHLAVNRGRQVYKIFDSPGSLEADIFEGRHEISGRRAYSFLKEKIT
jgi:dienelactone hydrolase